MAGGRDAVLALLDAADHRDLGRDLRARQHAAMSGLGPLAQLDLDHLDLRIGGDLGEFLGIEDSVWVAAAEIARADLPDDIAAVLAMVRRKAAFAGVMGEAALFGALVERPYGVGRERAEAHRRNVQGRDRIGFCAVRAADQDPKMRLVHWLGRERMA